MILKAKEVQKSLFPVSIPRRYVGQVVYTDVFSRGFVFVLVLADKMYLAMDSHEPDGVIGKVLHL